MKDEKAEFSARLRAALKDAHIEASASVLEKRFNARYDGPSVTAQAISGWLNGKTIPKQDKVRVLAAIVGMEPHELQFGGRARVGEGKAQWAETMGPQERAMVDAFLNLPAPQRKLVRELIMALSAQRSGSKGG